MQQGKSFMEWKHHQSVSVSGGWSQSANFKLNIFANFPNSILLIFNFIPMWSETSLHDFHRFKCIEACFMI